MNRTPLAKFLESSGMTQTELGRRVGITQGAINQMLHRQKHREIWVLEHHDGTIELEEIRRIRA